MKHAEQAEIFDLSISGLKKWIAEGFPAKGTLREMVAWVRKNRPLTGNTLTESRKRKIDAEAKLKELELMIKQGALISRDSVLREFLNRIYIVKAGLLGLPRSLPGKLVGKDGREMSMVIKRSVIDLLTKYSRKSGPLK
jgi:hypothetical protein